MGTEWKPAGGRGVYEGRDRKTGKANGRHARRPGLRLELAAARAGQVYACADAQAKFVSDFVAAWTKVMDLDRFDLHV